MPISAHRRSALWDPNESTIQVSPLGLVTDRRRVGVTRALRSCDQFQDGKALGIDSTTASTGKLPCETSGGGPMNNALHIFGRRASGASARPLSTASLGNPKCARR